MTKTVGNGHSLKIDLNDNKVPQFDKVIVLVSHGKNVTKKNTKGA